MSHATGAETARQTQELHIFHDVAKALTSSLDLDSILQTILEKMAEGNERGIAGDPCWATYDPVGANGGPASPGTWRNTGKNWWSRTFAPTSASPSASIR